MKFLILALASSLSYQVLAKECLYPHIYEQIKQETKKTVRDEARKRRIPWDESTFTFTPTVYFKVGNTTVSVVSPKSNPPYSPQLNYEVYEKVTDLKDQMGNVYARNCSIRVTGNFVLRNEDNNQIISDYREYSIYDRFQVDLNP